MCHQHRYRHGAEPKLVSLQWSQTDSQTIPWPVAGVASQAFFPSVAVEAAVEAAAAAAAAVAAAAAAEVAAAEEEEEEEENQ